MKTVYSDVIQFRGSHYDFGYQQGEWLKNSPILPNRNKQWASRRTRHFNINEDNARTAIMKYVPGVMDELHGLADSLKMNMYDALVEFGGYYLEYGKSGCSIFTGSDFMVRNYDNHPTTYEGRFVLYQPTDQGYAVIGPSMQITGRTDGMNEKGLAMGYNFVNRVNSGDGFICNMVGRIILETCANVDEAVAMLKEIPHRTSFNYILLDPNGETYIVEASPKRVDVRQSNVCTNHFELLTEANRYRMDDSLRRHKTMKEQESGIGDAYQAFQMMNSADKGVFSSKYGAWAGTLHTAAYLPREGKIWFAIGPDRLPVIFDLNSWLQGEKMNVKKIKGQLASESPFVNMEYI